MLKLLNLPTVELLNPQLGCNRRSKIFETLILILFIG
jgi:hypothetical protein